ncbi:MAG: hypothetical protein HY812_08945 [Planctomycetes bacterium]|nr:hypothetical protein [Planctomycetota bacterium]
MLVETGHARTAKAYILERDRRARIRAALRVRRDDKDAPAGQLPAVDAHARATVSAWSKGKIVEALILEADLPSGMADEIAAEVERRVFASGLTRISTALVRELVDNELFERGYERVLRRQTTIGLPRYDLDRLARSGAEGTAPPGCAGEVDRAVARSTWTCYSLLAIYPPEVVEGHLSGRLHVGALCSPTRFQALEAAIDPAAARAWDAAGSGDFAGLRLFARRAADLADESLVVHGAELLAAERLAQRGADARAVARALLVALASPGELPAERPRPWLGFPLAPSPLFIDALAAAGLPAGEVHALYRGFLAELCREAPVLQDAPRGVRPPALLFDLSALSTADLDVLEPAVLAEAAGLAAFRAQPLVGGTLEPFSPLLLRVDVNLAQAAFRARRFETPAALAQLAEVVALAAEACEARARHLAGLPGQSSPRERLRRLAPPGANVAGAGRYEIGLVGLDAACRIVFDHGLCEDGRAREFAQALVRGALDAVAREAQQRRLPLACAFGSEAEVLARLGRIDLERHPRGREVHGVPHDGVRYLYTPTLAFSGGEPEPREAARLEAQLRRDTVPQPPPSYHASARERALFLSCFAGATLGSDSACS